MSAAARITIDSQVCGGKPVLRGTRIPVSIVVGSLAGGMSFEQVRDEYGLSEEQVRAALGFAADRHPLPETGVGVQFPK